MKKTFIVSLVLGSLLAAPSYGQLLNNISLGNPKALALGNAVTADPPGIDSIHFNPAGLALLKERQFNLKLLVGHVELSSEFGEPIVPTTQGKRDYYSLNAICQGKYPITDPVGSPQELNAIDQCWGVDPVANGSSKTGDPIVMVPFLGTEEVPLLAFPMGGAVFHDDTHNWTIGTAAYVPEGIGYSRDEDSPGAYQGQQIALTRLTYFSPTIGFHFTDDLLIGMGLNFSYQGLYVQTQFRAPTLTLGYIRDLNDLQEIGSPLPPIEFNPYDRVGLLTMEMENFLSVGFNLGLLWQATPWLSLGFVYHSESKSNLEGDFSMQNSDSFLHTVEGLKENPLVSSLLYALGSSTLNAQQVESGKVKMEYITPQNLALGASIRVIPELKVNVDVKWAEYSRWESLDFHFDRDVDFLNFGTAISTAAGIDLATPDSMIISRNYEDTISWAIGVEYQWNDNLVLRAGYEPRTSAIPQESSDLLFPIGKADLYSAGLGWRYDRITTFDVAFAYLHSETFTPACASQNANSCVEGNVVYNPYYATEFKNEVEGYLFAISVDRQF